MKQFIHVDDNGNKVDTVSEAFVIGEFIRPEDSADRFAGLTFKIMITPENGFRAKIIDEHVAEFNRRPSGIRVGVENWCATGRAQYWLTPDMDSDDVICRDSDAPKRSAFNP
jgi:hypothetical protein